MRQMFSTGKTHLHGENVPIYIQQYESNFYLSFDLFDLNVFTVYSFFLSQYDFLTQKQKHWNGLPPVAVLSEPDILLHRDQMSAAS